MSSAKNTDLVNGSKREKGRRAQAVSSPNLVYKVLSHSYVYSFISSWLVGWLWFLCIALAVLEHRDSPASKVLGLGLERWLSG